MFEYEYVKLGGRKMLSSDFSKYRDIVDEYAQKGYRFVTYIPIRSMTRGELYEMDLVFEKEIK